MAERTDLVVALLSSIDRTLKQLVKQQQAAEPSAVADDRDLDGKYGNPVLKFMPRDWTGASFKNRTFSECPADLLDLVADSLDYFAKKADEADERTDRGKPVSEFRRKDAARARGWAQRIRAGRHQQEPPHGSPASPEWDDATPEGWGPQH